MGIGAMSILIKKEIKTPGPDGPLFSCPSPSAISGETQLEQAKCGCAAVGRRVACMCHHDTPGGVLMARRVNMHLDEEFVSEIERHKPKSLALAAFCAFLIEQALDKSAVPPLQPPVRGANKSSSASVVADESNPAFGGRGGPGGELPSDLELHRDLIQAFWKVKKGSKGEIAWKLLSTELLKIKNKYGDAVVTEQLQLAVNGTFQSITLRNYEQFLPKGHTAAQPEHKHPAAREFRNGRFVDEDGPTTNPALEGLF